MEVSKNGETKRSGAIEEQKRGTKRDKRVKKPQKIRKTDAVVFFSYSIVDFNLHILHSQLHLHLNIQSLYYCYIYQSSLLHFYIR